MGRQRRVQKQKGLYLRHHHHREAILDGLYHNFMCYYEGEYPTTREDLKPKWVKYGENVVLGAVDVGYDTYLASLNTADKVLHISNETTAYYYDITRTWIRQNYILTKQDMATKDGHIFRYCTGDSVYQLGARFGNGNKGIIHYSGMWTAQVTEIVDYESPDNQPSYGMKFVSRGTINIPQEFDPVPTGYYATTSCAYRGASENGAFFIVEQYMRSPQEQTSPYYYHHTRILKLYDVTLDGYTLVSTETYTSYGNASQMPSTGHFTNNREGILYHGGLYMTVYSYRTSDSPAHQGVYVYYTDTGSDWQEAELIADQLSTSTLAYETRIRFRNGYWYVFVKEMHGNYYKWRLFKSEDFTSVTEVTVPDYMDIPFLTEDGGHGSCIDVGDYDTLEIIFNNYDSTLPTPTSNVYQTPFDPQNVSEQAWDNSVTRGSIDDDVPNNWLVYSFTGALGGYYPIIVCIDINLTNSNDFAIIASNVEYYTDMPEEVQDSDYVYGGVNP